MLRPDPLIITDMSEADYHASTGLGEGKWITRSMLACMAESPRGFRLRYVNRHHWAQQGDTDCMDLGSLYESFLCYGRLPDGVHVRPATYKNDKDETKPWNANANVCKAWLAEHPNNVGSSLVNEAIRLAELTKEHAMCQAIITAGTHDEQTVIRWVDEETGLRLQVRLDLDIPGRLLGDIKTGAKDTVKDPAAFSDSARRFAYDVQAALYSDAWKIATGEELNFLFVYQQTAFPFSTSCLQLNPKQIAHGRKLYRQALKAIAAEQWELEQQDATTVSEIKPWVFYEMESG